MMMIMRMYYDNGGTMETKKKLITTDGTTLYYTFISFPLITACMSVNSALMRQI